MENLFESLDKETLLGILDDWAKNWLAHDGLWFQAVERASGIDTAIEADKEAWKEFTQIEDRANHWNVTESPKMVVFQR